MVYRGKPSKGCSDCRSRKVKCDQRIPECSQCIKAHRQCPGYRDQLDLMFCNENDGIEAKVRAREAKRKRKSPPSKFPTTDLVILSPPNETPSEFSSTPCYSSDSGDWLFTPSIQKALTPPVEDQAISFFFSNYVLDDQAITHGFLAHLYTRNQMKDVLPVIITSIGMAGLANALHAPTIMASARLRYCNALAMTNAALQDRSKVKDDQTLMSVILLGIFETITCENRYTMRNWLKHINGAATLMQLRGEEQLHSHNGLQMFLQLRAEILLGCMQTESPVPRFINDWVHSFYPDLLPDTPANRLFEICIGLCNLRAETRGMMLRNAEETIMRAITIDSQLELWAQSASYDLPYTIIPTSLSQNSDHPSRPIYGDSYHQYPDVGVANIWNSYRTARLLLNEILIDYLTPVINIPAASQTPLQQFLTTNYSSQRDRSLDLLQTLAEDVCASVPFHFETSSPTTMPGLRASATHIAGGYFLRWPLFVVGAMIGLKDDMRDWVIAQLEEIGRVMGVQQCVLMGRMLRNRQKTGLRAGASRKGVKRPLMWEDEFAAEEEGEHHVTECPYGFGCELDCPGAHIDCC